MATKLEKILNMLSDSEYEVLISPNYATESNFSTYFIGMRLGLFQFEDGDGDVWDCEMDEIDSILLSDGTEVEIDTLQDD